MIAGNGLYFLFAHTGDGGPALNAALNSPNAVAYDAQGNLYIAEADRLTESRRKGSSLPLPAGEVTPSAVAFRLCRQLSHLTSVWLSTRRVTYIFPSPRPTESANLRRAGTVVTVAGTGAAGFSGDRGPAASASLNGPYGLAVDGTGNLYISDNSNRRVRRVTPAGIISTIITNIDVSGLAFDNNGVAYVAGDGFVAKLTPGAANLSLVGGTPATAGYSGDGGPATAAQFTIC